MRSNPPLYRRNACVSEHLGPSLAQGFRNCVILVAVLALAACSSDKKPPLKGERISVLQLQNTLEVDKDAQDKSLDIPEAKDNTAWPQQGGNATHTPEHVTLGASLKKIWSADIGKGSTDDRKLITPPIAADGRVFTSDTKGNIKAFDLNSGKKLWDEHIPPKGSDPSVSSGLSYGDNVVYATDSFGGVVALSAADGKTIWKQQLPHPTRGSPTYQAGRIYLITLSDETVALDTQNGNVLWTHKGIEEQAGLLGSPSPAVQDSVVMTVYNSGDIAALRAETGQEAWSDNLTGVLETSNHAVTKLSGFRAHPVLDGDNVIIGNNTARLVDIHVPSGERTWQKEFGAAGTPWVAGNAVFVLTPQNELIALLKDTGEVKWVTTLARFKDAQKKEDLLFWNGPVLAGGRLILTSSKGKMIEVDPQSGKIEKQTDISSVVMLPPVVVQQTLLILSDNGTLSAYK